MRLPVLPRHAWAAATALLAAVLLAGCQGPPQAGLPARTVLAAPAAGPQTAGPPAVRRPPLGAWVDYQIGGAYPPARGVAVVVRDRHDRPAPGRYGVCYVNAFQTQPGELGWWRERHPQLLLRRHGQLVRDPGWPDEVLLDVRGPDRRRALAAAVAPWLRGCARSGYRAVELDNLDSYSRSHGLLLPAQALATARLMAAAAHHAGLAAAQKNAAELAPVGRRVGFDLAVAEECAVYVECGAYLRAYAGRVLEVECTDDGGAAFARVCRERGATASVVLRDRDDLPRGVRGHVSRQCPRADRGRP